jgi:hypothetical protein
MGGLGFASSLAMDSTRVVTAIVREWIDLASAFCVFVPFVRASLFYANRAPNTVWVEPISARYLYVDPAVMQTWVDI